MLGFSYYIFIFIEIEACFVKIVAGTCIELCNNICQLVLFVKISFFQCGNSYFVLNTITISVDIQRARTLVAI
jgi:hypothetical protein